MGISRHDLVHRCILLQCITLSQFCARSRSILLRCKLTQESHQAWPQLALQLPLRGLPLRQQMSSCMLGLLGGLAYLHLCVQEGSPWKCVLRASRFAALLCLFQVIRWNRLRPQLSEAWDNFWNLSKSSTALWNLRLQYHRVSRKSCCLDSLEYRCASCCSMYPHHRSIFPCQPSPQEPEEAKSTYWSKDHTNSNSQHYVFSTCLLFGHLWSLERSNISCSGHEQTLDRVNSAAWLVCWCEMIHLCSSFPFI